MFLECLNCLFCETVALERSWSTQIPFTLTLLYLTSAASHSPSLLFIEAWLHCEDVCKSSSWQMSSITDFNYFLSCMRWQKQESEKLLQPITLYLYFYL